jgi:hypothetical protein
VTIRYSVPKSSAVRFADMRTASSADWGELYSIVVVQGIDWEGEMERCALKERSSKESRSDGARDKKKPAAGL